MTDLQLFNSYHKPDITDVLKAYYLKTLRDRGNLGNSTARKLADKIDKCNKYGPIA